MNVQDSIYFYIFQNFLERNAISIFKEKKPSSADKES